MSSKQNPIQELTPKEKLLQAARVLGIKSVNMNTRLEVIRAAIEDKLGNPASHLTNEQQDEIVDSYVDVLNQTGEDSVAIKSGPVRAKSNDIPNLSPNGKWQGKRAKIRRTKTGHQDIGGAIFRWNGWPTIIPLDQEVDIAWPIYILIQDTVGTTVEVIQEESIKDKGRVNNIMKESQYQKYPFQFLGVTPGTEDLPESAWEYVLDQYVDDFESFSLRMWRQLCALWEMNDKTTGIMPGMGPDAEMVARRNAIHYLLNLPQTNDRAMRERVRNEKRADIGMTAKAA